MDVTVSAWLLVVLGLVAAAVLALRSPAARRAAATRQESGSSAETDLARLRAALEIRDDLLEDLVGIEVALTRILAAVPDGLPDEPRHRLAMVLSLVSRESHRARQVLSEHYHEGDGRTSAVDVLGHLVAAHAQPAPSPELELDARSSELAGLDLWLVSRVLTSVLDCVEHPDSAAVHTHEEPGRGTSTVVRITGRGPREDEGARERARALVEMLGGHLRVLEAPSPRTTVEARVPLGQRGPTDSPA